MTARNIPLEKFHPPIQYVRGFPFPGYPMYTKENIESALALEPKEDDLFIATYPKSGTTWAVYIIWEILNRGAPLPSIEDMNFRLVPYIELCGTSIAKTLPSPRVFKCHLNYHLVPKSKKAKYIYVYRNPKDTLVSRYFFTQEMLGTDINFYDYVDSFLSGSLAHGLWFEHVLSWYERRFDKNVLLISYEDMCINPRDSLFKMANFIGSHYKDLLEKDETLVNTILEQTSFDYMKKTIPVVVPTRDTDTGSEEENAQKFRKINFFRKGTTGDWRNHLSSEQAKKVNSLIMDKTVGTYLFRDLPSDNE